MKYSSKTLDIADKKLILETGVLAQQATSSVLGRLGDTMVLVTVVMGRVTELDYFPLSVDYVERLYAGGRIKGSKWVKREGRPSDDAILNARLIDRSIRPLFPKELKREVQIVVTVLSVDGQNDPAILAITATSAALAISKIPWNGPIGAVRVGLISDTAVNNGNKGFVINPDSGESDFLDLDMVVSATEDKVLMLEAGAKQIKEDVAFEAIKEAKIYTKKIITGINEMVEEIGEKKIQISKDEKFEEIITLVQKSYKDDILKVIEEGVSKENLGEDLDKISDRIYELEKENLEDKKKIKEAVDYVFKKSIRERILKEGKRPDGRAENEVRQISSKVGVLPRTHGSAIFQRGETQALTVVTLGAPSMEQLIESPEGEESKRYIHHYSMPPYSVGEAGRIGFLSRREIGHGALAERALLPVIPLESKFPYVIRVVSEVMSSNGSTSMASTCGSTLSLMDAGVPIIAPVAGLAIGLMSNENKNVILTDIIGLEDFSGDMDFKVAGTTTGITAIQLDVKISGITDEIIEKTFERAREGRIFILDKMLSVLSESRGEVSKFAPKIKVIKINPEKIGEVIGSGGRVIRNIIATTSANVEVEEDGSVTISGIDEEAVEKAISWIDLLTREFQKGEVFEGTVKRILPFGAMVEIVPGKEGLVHVSEMSTQYVKNPQDVVSVGQKVKVRVKEIDEQGRTNLSMVFGEKENSPEREHGQGAGERRPRSFSPNRDRYSQNPQRRRR